MKNENEMPTKKQIDELIKACRIIGLDNAAGFLTLASEEISSHLHKTEPICCCFEIMGDNENCPIHGGTFKNHGAFTDAEIKADYQERNDLYMMGMGA